MAMARLLKSSRRPSRLVLNPILAGAAMATSSVSAVGNSLRLYRFDNPDRAR